MKHPLKDNRAVSSDRIEHLTFNQGAFKKGRVLGFSHHWDKLNNPQFTTFRFPRKDRDWYIGEVVQIVYKPRSKEREILGLAKIVKKELRIFCHPEASHPLRIMISEAILDGFKTYGDMSLWFREQYGARIFSEPINRLTLEWVHPIGDLIDLIERCLEK